jgi:hypothetical protein
MQREHGGAIWYAWIRFSLATGGTWRARDAGDREALSPGGIEAFSDEKLGVKQNYASKK